MGYLVVRTLEVKGEDHIDGIVGMVDTLDIEAVTKCIEDSGYERSIWLTELDLECRRSYRNCLRIFGNTKPVSCYADVDAYRTFYYYVLDLVHGVEEI